MATLADFRTRFPVFVSVPDATVQISLDDATLEVSTAYGTYQDVATLFLAAHYLILSLDAESGSSGSVGATASEAVDGVSQSFVVAAADKQSDQLLSATIYGQRFLTYRDIISVGNVRIV